MIPVIITTEGITLFISGMPVSIARSHPKFDEIQAAAKAGNAEDVDALLNADKLRLERAAVAIEGTKISIRDGLVLAGDIPVAGVLATRMLEMLDEGWDLLPMARFIENLMENPSYRAVGELYEFLEKGQNPITEDGHFLAFKAVNHRFFDIHSNTFDNSVGTKPSVPRNQVDENPDRTCSYGLHVCSFDYLPHFAHEVGGHVMVVKVNPRDVVAIPRDYQNTKMRVTGYEVLSEYANYYQDRKDILAQVAVSNTGADLLFELEIMDSNGDVGSSRFNVLSEAAIEAEAILADARDEGEYCRVRIINRQTELVVFEDTVSADEEEFEQEFDSDMESRFDLSDDADEDKYMVFGYPIGETFRVTLGSTDSKAELFRLLDILDTSLVTSHHSDVSVLNLRTGEMRDVPFDN